MSKISTDNFYYCTLAQVNKIDNKINNKKAIHCNNEFKYTFAYLDLDKNNNYIDINDLKPIKSINSNNVNIGDWCIISKIRLDLKDKKYRMEYLKNIIEKVPNLLENNINSNYNKQIKKTL